MGNASNADFLRRVAFHKGARTFTPSNSRESAEFQELKARVHYNKAKYTLGKDKKKMLKASAYSRKLTRWTD